MERLWIRLGDQGDYEEVGGIDDAGDAIAYAASSGDTAVHSNWRIVGVFGLRGKDDTAPIAYVRGSTSFGTQIGVKGFSGTIMRWLGTTRAVGDTLSVNVARDRIIVGNVSLPWDPGVVPVI